MRKQGGQVNIRELSTQYFLSQKQFERKFKEHSGFMPKLYARIVRFETALSGYSRNRSLTEVGYESGYYDQSHFIHDFKKFSGHHPRSYFAAIPELV
jgi:AraC-like DNA-binding protein